MPRLHDCYICGTTTDQTLDSGAYVCQSCIELLFDSSCQCNGNCQGDCQKTKDCDGTTCDKKCDEECEECSLPQLELQGLDEQRKTEGCGSIQCSDCEWDGICEAYCTKQ